MATEETINSSTPAPSSGDAYPRDPVSTITDTAPKEATNPEESTEKAPAEGTEAKADKDVPDSTKEPVKETTTEAAAEVTTGKEDGKLDRFDKHPRFIELIDKAKKADERATRAETQLQELAKKFDELSKRMDPPKQEAADIDEDELADLFDTNPALALKKVAEVAEQMAYQKLISEISERETYDTRRKQLDDFTEQFPDFKEKWDSGDLARMVDENPIHNPISAYLLTSLQGISEKHQAEMTKAVSEAVEAARKEEQEKARKQLEEAEKNFKAKRSIRVVDDTPGVTSTAPDNKSELRELKGHSLIERIAGNLSARRAAN